MKPIEADIRLGKETETRARAVDPPSRFTCDDARTRGRTHRSLRLHASRAFPQRARRGKVLPIASSSRDLAAATRSLIVEILCTQSGFDRMRERKRERGRGRERERERENPRCEETDRSRLLLIKSPKGRQRGGLSGAPRVRISPREVDDSPASE